jgi:hypothetical protein
MTSAAMINAILRPRCRFTMPGGWFGVPAGPPLEDGWEAGGTGRVVSEYFCCSSIGSVR